MRVAHRHLDGGVAHQLLDGLEWSATHRQVAREGMAQAVPANLSQPRSSARPSQWLSSRLIRKASTSFVAENEVALQMTMSFEEPNGCLAQRNFPRSAVLGRANLTPPIGAPDDQSPSDEIDVSALQRKQLAHSQPGFQRERYHRKPLRRRSRKQAIRFFESQEVEFRLRALEPFHSGDVLKNPPIDRYIQQLVESGELVVDRFW